jgi:hypothetical protein
LCNNTIVDCNIDMNYHARTSKEMGAVPLKRLVDAPYHYTDAVVGNEPDEPPDLDFSNLAIHAAFEARAQHLQRTGKRVRRSKRSRSKGPRPTKAKELSNCGEWDPAFMSEIALQGLLDRTKADEQDEEAMDMTIINGVRMSKYDIRALKVGLKITPEMLHELTEFNKNYVGKNSVFPDKNGAPRILEQF